MDEYPLLRFLHTFEALGSETRLKIVSLLAKRPMHITALADVLGTSLPTITGHIHKLEEAGLVKSSVAPGRHGSQKVCELAIDNISIPFRSDDPQAECYRVEMPVGHYVDWDVKPTCGLATVDRFIGHFDDPRFFADPSRVQAGMIWFASGYVQYRFPNFLLPSQEPVALEFTAELGSEAPTHNNDWPSDIDFTVNGLDAGMWTSPGDFGGRRGVYTPKWISEIMNQYGLLKVLRIDNQGTSMDGMPISDIKISDLTLDSRSDITLKIESPETVEHAGGVTIFGRDFGNYGRDLEMRLFYKPRRIPQTTS